MIEIDGSTGEGGGQVLRTSLALSLATSVPFRLVNIRAKRKTPGLRPQHLASVRAAVAVGDAEVEGATRGSPTLAFRPRALSPPKDLHVDVGTAGSATLVVQTVLAPLLTAKAPSRLTVDGGTHNPWAPPYEFLAHVYFPLLERMGPRLGSRLVRHGFVPDGGGRIVVEVEPADRLAPFELLERGAVLSRRAVAITSKLPRHIANRELRVVERRLGWPAEEREVREVRQAKGPGNALWLEVESEHVTEGFFSPGEIGVRAETVASRAVTETLRYADADVPVGEHLADQLLLPLALGAGGRFRTLPLSSHAHTQIELLRLFLNVRIDLEAAPAGAIEVRVHSS